MNDIIKQYDMNDAGTRREVFWLLKRLTSYTLWERKRDAWEIFTRAYEDAVKTWPKSQPEQVEADNLPRIYGILSAYNKGLDELQKGYRFVWRIGQPLFEAKRESGVILTNFYRHPAYWERGMQLEPYPPRIEALNQLMLASRYQGDQSPLEIDYASSHLGAYWSNPGNLLNPSAYNYGFYELPYPVFPPLLPDVPVGTDILIQSGQSVPVDGIWEPVKIHQDRLLGIIPLGGREVMNSGCFNYLVSETQAPRIAEYNEATSRVEQVGTHWRLLWKDERYKDGIVADESGYFLATDVGAQKPPKVNDVALEVRTGEECPVSGLWVAKDYEAAPIQVAAGNVMPDLMVRSNLGEQTVHWVTWHLVKPD
ncbi:Imm72 family immunity protein [Paraburkholderia sp. D1E]|uniref:Imm72 family immunity protein n=1 Tax=Paraburkholderia sp. D1E TaxID=3461398 RepID=UPI004045368A